jgi:hypothetical protein
VSLLTVVAGWTSSLLTASGDSPSFSADGKSVLVQRGYYPQVQLVKIEIATGKAQVLAQSKYASALHVAPDESVIAFTEFYQLYLTPLEGTCRPVRRIAFRWSSSDGEWALLAGEKKPVSVSSRPGHQPSRLQRASANGLHYVTWAKNGEGKWDLLWIHASEAYRVSTQQARRSPPSSLSLTLVAWLVVMGVARRWRATTWTLTA